MEEGAADWLRLLPLETGGLAVEERFLETGTSFLVLRLALDSPKPITAMKNREKKRQTKET
jgi:hypothetical protein